MSSLQEWLAAKRDQLAADRTEVLPVPGYEERLAGRYRLVTLGKAEDISQKADTPMERAADLLIWSCVEILEILGEDEDGKPQYRTTGHKWTLEGVRKLFGLEMPEGSTSRDALFAVFPPPLGEYKLIRHVREIDAALSTVTEEIDEGIRGNSGARSAETEPSISQ